LETIIFSFHVKPLEGIFIFHIYIRKPREVPHDHPPTHRGRALLSHQGYKYQADTMPSFYEAAESLVVEAGFNNRDVPWPRGFGFGFGSDRQRTGSDLRIGT